MTKEGLFWWHITSGMFFFALSYRFVSCKDYYARQKWLVNKVLEAMGCVCVYVKHVSQGL